MPANGASDTDPKAAEVQLGVFRQMTPAGKVRAVFELTDLVLRLSEAGVRQLYPGATERDVFLRAAVRRLGRETVERAYGWRPETP